jgi:HNH endonuclease
MTDEILADQVRAFAYRTYVLPGLASSKVVTVRAGDVHSAMGFTQRVPLVCASLRARQFQNQFSLELLRTEGPKTSTTTVFVFAKARKQLGVPSSGVAWAEITSLEHGHGGSGWELGRWLWSPTTSKDGADRYGIMQQPTPGERVFHLVSGVSAADPRRRVLFGVSQVSAAAEVTVTKPPLPGVWANAEAYFRIALAHFEELSVKLPMDELEEDLSEVILADLAARPKYYPYAPYRDGFRGSQGIYLTKLSPALAQALREISELLERSEAPLDEPAARACLRVFAEGERSRRESAFFRRNPALRTAAIKAHGLRCIACETNFAEAYGPLGEGYIEIHHINPLAERLDPLSGEPSLTTVEDVVPLCANCHRMVHRRRPALSVDELQLAISLAPRWAPLVCK